MCQVKFEASGAEHEAVNYTFLDWFFYEWPRVVKEVERFFDLFSAEDRRRLLKKDWTMKMKKALLTWATGKLSDAPSRLTNVQVLIAAMIFGEGNWEDPLPVPPVEDPENIKECFDSSKYTPQQCLGAFRRILAYTRVIDEEGGFGFIDKNTVVVGKLKDLEEDDLEDEDEVDYRNVKSLEDHLCKMGWNRFFHSSILPVVVLKKDNLVDEVGLFICFRLLFLYTPFCWATFWNPNCTKVSLKQIWSMARTIMQCQVSYWNRRTCILIRDSTGTHFLFHLQVASDGRHGLDD